MAEQLTDQEAAVVLNGADPTTCPECGREFPTVQAMRGHLASHRGKQARAGQTGPPGGAQGAIRREPVSIAQLLDAAGKETVRKAVKNAKTVGNLLAFGAPHVGLAIAGQDPAQQSPEWRLENPGAIYVRSRAELAAELILEIRDPDVLRQVLRILTAFNALFEVEKVAELGGSLIVATAVDVRVIPPDFKMRVGPMELPIAEATIGDVVAEWQRRGLYEQGGPPPPGGGDGGHPAWPPSGGQPGAEVVEGGVTNT